MDNNKTSNVYRMTMYIMIGMMIASFFLPWVESTVGKESKIYHFIGILSGSRKHSLSSEEVYDRVTTYSSNFFLVLITFIVFALVVYIHYKAIQVIHEKKAVAVLVDIIIQYIYIVPCISNFLTTYRDYYNENHKGVYPMECHLKWGFYVYLALFFVTYVVGFIFGPLKNEKEQKDYATTGNDRL